MAANIKTVMKEMISLEEVTEQKEVEFREGLSYALFGDNLDSNDWLILNNIYDPNQSLIERIIDLYPKYYKAWNELGQPKTAEEWQAAKYKDE